MARRFRLLRRQVEEKASAEALRATLLAFESETLDHFAVEETMIFPLLVGVAGGGAIDAVKVLLEEHEALRKSLQAFAEAVRAGEGQLEAFAAFRDQLLRHQAHEERMLYPIFDMLCPDAIRDLVENQVRRRRHRAH